jgi:hypothetical protein
MNTTDWFIVVSLAGAAGAAWVWLPVPDRWLALGGVCVLALLRQTRRVRAERQVVIKLAGLSWDRHAFCQGWLITGCTGSGKTLSGILQILNQLFRRKHSFGLLSVDDKGVLCEPLGAMARHYGRDRDTILLQTRPPEAGADWKAPQRFNLIGDRSIPAATYARCVVGTAVALGDRQEQALFRRAAQILIGQGITAQEALGYDVTLENTYLRESGAAFIAATQSTTSLTPPLGAQQAKVLTLNLRNRLIFTAADEDDATASADFLGKKTIRKKSWTSSGGRRSETWSEEEVHRIKPHKLRALRKHQCIVVHADKGFRKCILPPLEPDGSVSPWFRRFRWPG